MNYTPLTKMICANCGSEQPDQAKFCAFCGSALNSGIQQQNQQRVTGQQNQQVPQINQEMFYQQPQSQYQPPQNQYPIQYQGYQAPNQQYGQKPKKDKVIAGILGILLGGFGVHKFYLGDIGLGILYLIFFWSGIPAIIGLIEGILYLVASDEEFQQKYVKG